MRELWILFEVRRSKCGRLDIFEIRCVGRNRLDSKMRFDWSYY